MSGMITLNDSNYFVWKVRMEDLLYVEDYYLPVFSDEKPENMTDKQWDILHRQVCGYIRKWVDSSELRCISGETNARALWNKLEEFYGRNTLKYKVSLIRRLKSLKYRDGTSMMAHISEFLGIISQLSAVGMKFDDESEGIWLLCTLPDSWKTFTMSLCISAPNDKFTLDFVKDKLLKEEVWRKLRKLDALDIESRGRSKNKDMEKRQNNRSKSRGRYSNVECYYCGKKGHIQRVCREATRDEKER